MLIGVYVFVRFWNKTENQISFIFYFSLFSLIIAHFLFVIYFVNTGESAFEELFFVFVPVYLYIFFSLLASNYFVSISPIIIEQVFLKLSLASIIIAIITYLIYFFDVLSYTMTLII